MESAWLADEKPPIAIVVDKDTRRKVATTSVIDRKKIFRRMTRFPLKGANKTVQFRAETAFQ
jgi:hypothetical protein